MPRAKEVSFFFLLFAAVFGLTVRLFPLVKAGFPLVDGGMFYAMTRDLQAARYALPLFASFNRLYIPYAYPPFGFYLAAGLNDLTGVSLFQIIRWIPLVFNLAALPVFYLLLARILDSKPRAALALLVFSLAPNSYWWTIVGGGLTRSPGTFFFILTLFFVYEMYRSERPAWTFAAVLSGSLVALSHLAWALQTLAAVPLFWYFFGRSRQNLLRSFLVALGVLLLTSPWWGSVLLHHGLGVFAQAFQVNHSRLLAWTILFAFSFTGEYTTVIAVFAMAGLFLCLRKRDYFFVAWALLCLLIDPRGGSYAAIFPFSVLAMSALADGIAPRLGNPVPEHSEAWTSALNAAAGRLFFGFFIIVFFYNAYVVSERLSREVLNPSQREALEWIRTNTEAEASFLVLDEQGNPLLSPFVEWFPALSERRSLTTIQGTEWLTGGLHYNAQMPLIVSLRNCLIQDAGCLSAEADYIVVSASTRVPLLASLQEQPEKFAAVYASPSVKVFKVR